MELVALRIVIEFMGKADADFGLRLRGRSDAASTHQFTGVHLFRSVQVFNGLPPFAPWLKPLYQGDSRVIIPCLFLQE